MLTKAWLGLAEYEGERFVEELPGEEEDYGGIVKVL